jgi:23S rRNA (adenine2503-C2)-methyltransferase
MTSPASRTELLRLTQPEWTERLGSSDRARALARWLFSDEARALLTPSLDLDAETTTPIELAIPERIDGVSHRVLDPLRASLALTVPRCRARHVSDDGTIKYALCVGGDASIESVLIPTRGRSTLCVSSQIGCTRRCAFCATARLGFCRNLRAEEIVAQFWRARSDAPTASPLRNVVFMGMGEPLDNLDEVLRAIDVLTQQPEPQLSARNITVSTSGILPGMARLLSESRVNLALSLNATTDECRRALMPQTEAWPMTDLLALLRNDARMNPGRDVFVEMVLFDGINDSEDDAHRLVALLYGVNARVNLIAHNAFDGSPFRPTSEARLRRFKQIVLGAGIRCLTRVPRGQEISAACGQLALRHQHRPRNPDQNGAPPLP